MLTIQELEALRGLVQINVNINLPKGHHMAYDQVRLPFTWLPLSITAPTFLPGIPLCVVAPAGVTDIVVDSWSEASGLYVDGLDLVRFKNVSLTSIGYGFPGIASTTFGGSDLESIELGPLASISGRLYFANRDKLTSVLAPSLTVLAGDLDGSGCALTEANVDALLLLLVNATTDGATPWAGTADLSGGTNAVPSAAGLASKATLEGRGATVTVNT